MIKNYCSYLRLKKSKVTASKVAKLYRLFGLNTIKHKFISVFVTVSLTIMRNSVPLLTLGAHGYSSRSVCLCVRLSVCLSATILTLQATRRLMSDTDSVSGTWVRK